MVKNSKIDKIYKILRSHTFIVFVFFVLSLLSAILLWKSHFVGWAQDAHFQWSRIYELRNSIKSGDLFPNIALNKFFETGVAVMAMYPKLNLYPIVMLSFFIKSFVHLVYVLFIIKTFLSLLIAYISSYMFNRSRKISFVFSTSYSLSVIMLFYSFRNMDIGVSSALVFLPLVLFGMYEFLDNPSHWKELSLGVSLIILCHILTAIMTILLILTIILLNYACLKNKKFILSLIKIGVSILLITSIFWIPFLMILIQNNIYSVDLSPLSGTEFTSFIGFIFNNSVGTDSGPYINIFAFIGLILGIINYKNMSKYTKQIFWISIVILIIASSLFPWNILTNTFIKMIQFTWRLYIIPQLLLIYVFADNVIHLCKDRKQTIIVLLLITLSVMCTQIIGQRELIDYYVKFPNYAFDSSYVIKDDNLFNRDYRPVKVNPVLNTMKNHEGTYETNHHIIVNRLENGKFSFELNSNVSSFSLPFVMFNGIDYQIKVDGNNYKFHADQYTRLTINHLSKGKHTVQVIVHKSWYDYLSYVLSALGVIILAFAWIRLLILKRKNKE